MTRDDIIRMAREAELLDSDGTGYCPIGYIERFAALVAAAEREDGIPDMPIKVQDDRESPPESWAQSEQVNGIDRWIKANTEHRQWYICPKCSYQAPRFKDEWQGLTDEERTFLAWESNNGPHCVAITEAKLKEKNSD